jgi:hypothetical protein
MNVAIISRVTNRRPPIFTVSNFTRGFPIPRNAHLAEVEACTLRSSGGSHFATFASGINSPLQVLISTSFRRSSAGLEAG